MNKKCKSKAEADKMMGKTQVQFALTDNYFDSEEYGENPVKTIINFDYYFPLN